MDTTTRLRLIQALRDGDVSTARALFAEPSVTSNVAAAESILAAAGETNRMFAIIATIAQLSEQLSPVSPWFYISDTYRLVLDGADGPHYDTVAWLFGDAALRFRMPRTLAFILRGLVALAVRDAAVDMLELLLTSRVFTEHTTTLEREHTLNVTLCWWVGGASVDIMRVLVAHGGSLQKVAPTQAGSKSAGSVEILDALVADGLCIVGKRHGVARTANQDQSGAFMAALIEAGADPRDPDDEALYSAATRLVAPLVDILLAAHIDLNGRNKYSSTPLLAMLSRAATPGITRSKKLDRTIQIAHQLLESGADPNVADRVGVTVLEYAMDLLSLDLLEDLLAHGADPNLVGTNGETCLHRIHRLSPWAQVYEAAKLFLRYGADPNVKDSRGRTVLHVLLSTHIPAAILLSLIQSLVEHGADPTAVTNHGQTPLDVYKRCNDSKIDGAVLDSLVALG